MKFEEIEKEYLQKFYPEFFEKIYKEYGEFKKELIRMDGDCGYAALGLAREEAYELLLKAFELQDEKNTEHKKIKNREELIAAIAPAIRELLINDPDFLNYLKEKKVDVSKIDAENDQEYLPSDSVIREYLEYDVLNRKANLGWAHVSVLQTLVLTLDKRLRIWIKDKEKKTFQPHFDKHYADFNSKQTDRIDLLYENSSHFNRLKFQQKNIDINYFSRVQEMKDLSRKERRSQLLYIIYLYEAYSLENTSLKEALQNEVWALFFKDDVLTKPSDIGEKNYPFKEYYDKACERYGIELQNLLDPKGNEKVHIEHIHNKFEETWSKLEQLSKQKEEDLSGIKKYLSSLIDLYLSDTHKEDDSLQKLISLSELVRKFEKALDLDIQKKWNDFTANKVNELKEKGNTCFRKKEYDAALKFYEKSVQINPDFPIGYLNIGQCYFEKNDLKKALEFFLLTLQKDKRYKKAENRAIACYAQLGKDYFDKKEYLEAYKCYRQVVYLDSSKSRIYCKSEEQYKNLKEDECNDGYVCVKDKLFFRGELVPIADQKIFIQVRDQLIKEHADASCIELTAEEYEKLITNNVYESNYGYSRNPEMAERMVKCELKVHFHGTGLY